MSRARAAPPRPAPRPPAPPRPTLLTSIVNFRTKEMALRAAEAALAAMEGIDGGIVVLDNDSGDGSAEWLRAQVAGRGWDAGGRVRVVESPCNGGFGAGHNAAMAAGLPNGRRPDHVYLLNSDAFPAPDAVRRLLDAMEADPGIGLAGSYIHGPGGEPHCTCFRFPSVAGEFESALGFGPVSRLLSRSVVAMPIPQETIELDWTAGASLMMRQDMLDAIGGFDEGFFLYFEETDLCRRARAAGWRVAYVRASEVEHIGSVSTGMKDWERIPSYYLDSRLRYFVKSHGAAYAAAATLAFAVGAVGGGLRDLVRPRPRRRAEHYARDMLSHHSRAAARGLTGRPGASSRARRDVEAAHRG